MITRIYLGAPKEAPPAGSIQALERELATRAGGFTAFAGSGVWLGPEGIVEEMAYVYEIVHDSSSVIQEVVREFALAMKELLKQQEVLVVHLQAEKEVL